MGLMRKLRGELVDVVEWVDDSRHTLVWRFPRYHNQIKHGAQLIVRPGQTAILVREGRIADRFGPGQYRLETRNLPILSTLGGWKHGFDSPFKAEVYFVSTRQITDLKWGTPNPVLLRDPDFGPIRVRGFGTYTLKASEPVRLLEELVGADSHFDADEVTELLRSIIGTAFADLVAKSDIPVLDLAENQRELSEQLRRIVMERVDDEYGLEIPQLYIVNVSVPAEVEEAFDTRASMGVIGDLAAFQQYQLGHAMPVAAANPAGGLAGAGLGLGMGMAMAMPPGAARAGGMAPPPPPAGVWHVAEGGQSLGPFAVEHLAQAARQGRLRPDSLVWCPGMGDWAPASGVAALAALFPPGPPPPPASD
jgi:membrane protease subunit (stomatin/prohibitin family)